MNCAQPTLENYYSEEKHLLSHLIHQRNMNDFVFMFSPNRTHWLKQYQAENYYQNRTKGLLQLFGDNLAQAKIAEYLSRIKDEDGMLLVMDLLSSPYTLIDTGESSSFFINFKHLQNEKEKMVLNQYFLQRDYHTSSYIFYYVFLYEIETIRNLISENNKLTLSEMGMDDYINIATHSLNTYLKRYEDFTPHTNWFFEYFFCRFTSQFSEQPYFEDFRTKLVRELAFELGGKSMRNIISLTESNQQ